MVSADRALGVGVHVQVAGVPEEPDVFGCCDWWGVEEIVVDEGIWTEV